MTQKPIDSAVSHYQGKTGQRLSMVGTYRFTIRDAITGKIKRKYTYKNLITTAGMAAIASRMTNPAPSGTMLINKFAIGTGTNAPALGDTQLQTETYRNDVASRTSSGRIAYVTGFLDAVEATGTFREAGLFMDGLAGANTGTLLSRVAINVVKSNTETLTMDYELEFNNA